MDDLKSDEALLRRLNPELLDEAASLFGVRVEWLEGEDNRIYACFSNYKDPQKFFELFNSIKYEKFKYSNLQQTGYGHTITNVPTWHWVELQWAHPSRQKSV